MKRKGFLLWLSAAVFVFLSCNKSTIDDFEVELGYRYFPLEIGQSRLYAVDSVIFDPTAQFNRIDTVSGFFREDLVDTLRDNSGALQFRIERYYRREASDPWQIHSVVSSSRGDREAIYTENNLSQIKLRFPLEVDLEWDGTARFPEGVILEIAGESIDFYKGWKNRILEYRDQYPVEGQTFSDVYLVQTADLENVIEYRYGLEVYAPDQGLIYQEIWVLDSQCELCCNGDIAGCTNLSWLERGEKGVILKKRLLE